MSRRGLGRGLGALIPTGPTSGQAPSFAPTPVATTEDGSNGTEPNGVDVADVDGFRVLDSPEPIESIGAYFAEIALDRITPNPRQPRQAFDTDEMAELVHSIQEVGLLQPIVVRPLEDERYELIVGERRWRASQQADTGTIPAIVRETQDDEMLRNALLENLHRSQLNALEEAAAYDQLLQDFDCTHDELAARIGRSRPQISNTIRLLKLPPTVQRRVAAGVLSAGHARALLSLEDTDAQDRLAHRIVAEGLSVRAVEEIVAVGGDSSGQRTRTRTSRATAPGLEDLAGRLSERLETRVRVDLGRSKGKVVIEFASLDDLRRIVDMIAPLAPDPISDQV